MKNIYLTMVLLLTVSVAFAGNSILTSNTNKEQVFVTATHSTVTVESKEDLAYCEIRDGGFFASGRCKTVLRAYRQWKAMQIQ